MSLLFAVVLSCTCAAFSQFPDLPGQIEPGQEAVNEAYLFAHTMSDDYRYGVYYSVSLDGLHWSILNGGKRVFEDYIGHPDITRGHDGRYYLIGNQGHSYPDINFWVSDDLIHWDKYSDYTPDLERIPDHEDSRSIGAPKLFFDRDSSQYLVTWHTTHDLSETYTKEEYWAGMRTIYATSNDLKTFSDPPRKLFDWDMATIDTIVRRIGGTYYAIIKDEQYPMSATSKTIRICNSPNLLGPYTQPGDPVSPSWREAPTLIPSPDGTVWYLFYEEYPGRSYGLSFAEEMEGPWFQTTDPSQYKVTPEARHGCMIAITRSEYDALMKAFSGLVHRYSFTDSLEDSVGGADATLIVQDPVTYPAVFEDATGTSGDSTKRQLFLNNTGETTSPPRSDEDLIMSRIWPRAWEMFWLFRS